MVYSYPEYIFFCTEADYPDFVALLPGKFPTTYNEFVAFVDDSIKQSMEQITLTKTYVRPAEFESYCARSGEAPNYDALVRCTAHVHARATGGRGSHDRS